MTVFKNFKNQSQRQEFSRTYLGIVKNQSQRQEFSRTYLGIVKNQSQH